MAVANTVSTLNGFYKDIYGDSIIDLIPRIQKILKGVSFQKSKKLGKFYHVPVVVQDEQGFTYNNGTDVASGGSFGNMFSLNGYEAMAMADAQIRGTELVLQSGVSYGAAETASSSKEAFADFSSVLFERMVESTSKRKEIAYLYGGSSIGSFNAISGSSTTQRTITFTGASFSIGIFSGLKGAKIQFYDNASPAVLISSGANSIFTIVSFNIANKTLTVDGTSTGITALAAAFPGTIHAYFNGAYGNEPVGIDKIITTNGPLFGIDNSTYDLYQGNVYTISSGGLTMDHIQKAVAVAAARGLIEPVKAYMTPSQFTKLALDQSSSRRYDQSYNGKKATTGFASLEYHGPQGDLISIEPHPYMKDGEVFIIPLDRFKRVGSTDITFQTPGREEEIFTQVPDKAGYEVRLYSNDAIFCEAPSRCVKITGFTV